MPLWKESVGTGLSTGKGLRWGWGEACVTQGSHEVHGPSAHSGTSPSPGAGTYTDSQMVCTMITE